MVPDYKYVVVFINKQLFKKSYNFCLDLDSLTTTSCRMKFYSNGCKHQTGLIYQHYINMCHWKDNQRRSYLMNRWHECILPGGICVRFNIEKNGKLTLCDK